MRYFTSDLHLGHAAIIGYTDRPYADVADMNAALVANWNAVVADDDEVWVLGDVALGRITETLPLARQLRGRKHLVPGNHDRCWTGHKRVRIQDVQLYADAGFEIHPNQLELRLVDRTVLLCHFPVTGDSQPRDRYLEHRPDLPPGQWLLHGHVHNNGFVHDRQVNVGVDVWDYRPVSEPALLELMSSYDG